MRAFALTGRPDYRTDGLPPYQPQKLYFYTIPRRYLRWAVRLLPLFGKDPHHWGRNGDVDLASLVVEDFPVHAMVDISTVQELKTEASLCHESQGGSGMVRGLMGWLGRIGGSREAFMRAYPEPEGKVHEKDLLSGVELN